jgi:hypothetical protein
MDENAPKDGVSNVQLAMGILTLQQAATQIAPLLGRDDDPMLMLKRLIARRSLDTVATPVKGEFRIAVEALAGIIKGGPIAVSSRGTMGMPNETLKPLFPIVGRWFETPRQFGVDGFVGAIYGELEKQIPLNLAGGKYSPSWEPKLNLAATITPALQAIIRQPVPTSNPIFGDAPDGSAFSGVGEIFLASQLQFLAAWEIQQRANADYRNVGAEGVGPLYASPEAYKSIVEAAMVAFQTRTYFSLTRDISQNDPKKADTMLPMVRVVLSISNDTIMQIVGTNLPRIGCLAF